MIYIGRNVQDQKVRLHFRLHHAFMAYLSFILGSNWFQFQHYMQHSMNKKCEVHCTCRTCLFYPASLGNLAKLDFYRMFEAFVQVYQIWFLKILSHIPLALEILFPKHVLILLLDKILLQKNLLQGNICRAFDTVYWKRPRKYI